MWFWHALVKLAVNHLTFELVLQLETGERVHEDRRVELVLGEDEHAAVAVGGQHADAAHVTVEHALLLGLQVQEADVAAAHVAHGVVVDELQAAGALYPAERRVEKANMQLLATL